MSKQKLRQQAFKLSETYPELDFLHPIAYAAKIGDEGYIVSALSPLSDEEKVSVLGLTNHQGLTPLHFACLYGKVEAAEALISLGASEDKTTLLGFLPAHLIFSDNHDLPTCQALFYLFRNSIDWLSMRNNAGETIAHLAAIKGAVDILRTIKGIKPELLNRKDNFAQTPLMKAVLNNQLKTAQFLLENSDIQQVNSKGRSALHLAVLSSSIEMMTLVLPYFDVNTPDYENHSPLELSVAYGFVEKEKVLQHALTKPSP